MSRSNQFFAVLGRVLAALFVAVWLEAWVERSAYLGHLTQSQVMGAQGELPGVMKVGYGLATFLDRYFAFVVTLPLLVLVTWWGVRSVRREGRSEEGRPRGAAPTDVR